MDLRGALWASAGWCEYTQSVNSRHVSTYWRVTFSLWKLSTLGASQKNYSTRQPLPCRTL